MREPLKSVGNIQLQIKDWALNLWSSTQLGKQTSYFTTKTFIF